MAVMVFHVVLVMEISVCQDSKSCHVGLHVTLLTLHSNIV